MNDLGTPDRPWPIRVRNDLSVSEQSFRGQKLFVVGNPANGEHFYLPEQQYGLLQLFDGKRTPNEIKDAFQKQFAPSRLEIREIEQQTIQLFEKGLVESMATGMGDRLIVKERKRVSKKRLESLMSIVSLRMRGIDPSGIFAQITPYTKWIFAWPMVVINLAFFLITIVFLLINISEFRSRLPATFEFFSGGNLLGFALVFSLVKILHEFGHGILYTAFGGRCRNLGLSLLVFVPTLYVDTTDSWRMKSKWRRAGIAAAGMYVESILASLAVWMWWITAPGIVHYTALQVLGSCLLSSVAFNANPLVKSDGYFILSDLIEIPNLASKGAARLRYHLRHFFFVEETDLDEPFDKSAKRILVIYGLFAIVYRILLLSGIAWLMLKFSSGYGAESLAYVLVTAFLGLTLFSPLRSAWTFSKRHDLWIRARKPRMAVVAAIIGSLLLGVTVIPISDRVVCDFVMEPDNCLVVRCPEAGILSELYIHPGEWVNCGDAIAKIRNIDLEIQLAEVRGELNSLVARESTLMGAAIVSPEVWRERQDIQEKIRSRSELVRELEGRQEALTLLAPRDGHVISIWYDDSEVSGDDVGFHSGWGLCVDTPTRFVRKNEALCRIADRENFRAKVFIPQDSVREISNSAKVRLLPRTGLISIANGEVVGVSECNVEELPKSLSLRFGGGHESKHRQPRKHSVEQGFHVADTTDETIYAATVELTSKLPARYFDSVGLAKVELTKKSLLYWCWHRLAKSLRFDLLS